MHGTTVLCIRKENKVVLIADGQVTLGDHVLKHTARKTRRLYNDKVLAGFAGSTADAFPCSNGLKESFRNIPAICKKLRWNWPRNGAKTGRCGIWKLY